MRLIDITRVAQEAKIYPDDPPIFIEKISDIGNGCEYTCSKIVTSSHAGTHADAVCHYIENGVSIDKMDLESYYGTCRVIEVPKNATITKEVLLGKVEGIGRVLLKGSENSYLGKEASEYLVECGVKCVLTEALSVASFENEKQIHTILLGSKVAIVENIILDGVSVGEYLLCAFPIKYGGCDGAPVRAVLIDEKS